MNLNDQIAELEARLHQLRRQRDAASCAEVGHRWTHIGGRNAGCGPDCCCSVPVHRCEVCGDCDYGDNPEAAEVVSECDDSAEDDLAFAALSQGGQQG